MLQVAVLTRQMQVPRPLVSQEVVPDALPGRVGVDCTAHDHLEDGVLKGEEDPEDQPLVHGEPGGLGVRRSASRDMVLDAILGEDTCEESAPLNVVVLGRVELEFDMVGDVIVVKVLEKRIGRRREGGSQRGG